MPLFELDDGRLIPAQFGHEVPNGFTEDILEAISAQVLQIVSRPLFPITWNTIGGSGEDRQPRLTALDASGQVVAVEVVRSLDAEILIDALSRLSDTAAMSWTRLAREYPQGEEGFKREWISFRDAMPTSPPNGPRLILVAANISSDVRPALDVLSSSGVEVHEMSLRQMSNGRAFLEVDAVGPRLYGHRANSLVEASEVVPELVAKTKHSGSHVEPAREVTGPQASKTTIPTTHGAPEQFADEKPRSVPRQKPLTAPPAPGFTEKTEPEHTATQVPSQRPKRPVTKAPVARANVPGRMRRRNEVHSVRPRRRSSEIPFPSRLQVHEKPSQAPQKLQQDAGGLLVLAEMTGGETPLALHPASRTPRGAALTAEGAIRVPSGVFSDPTAALIAEGISGEDGWQAWSLGDQFGPTLAEALEEVNQAGA